MQGNGGDTELCIDGMRVLVCDCEGTMRIDGKALARTLGGGQLRVHRHLCRAQLEAFESAAAHGQPLLVACTQEAPLFSQVLAETDGAPEVRFTNIRERAGWSDEGRRATPKMAALLAEAALELPMTTSVAMRSDGVVLVLGRDAGAIDAARQVASRLDVTVVIDGAVEAPPPGRMDFPIFRGTVTGAHGHLGAFQMELQDYAPASPSARSSLAFEADGAVGTSKCDLILDLRRATPLFTAPEKRDGYFNPDPDDAVGVQRALLDLTDMVGEFEKPRYLDYSADLCAHGRNGRTGCRRCLDGCAAGAIAEDGDHVAIDPYVCAGCGTCAAVCPTGAAAYAMPAGDGLLRRLRTLLGTFTEAGGTAPALLVHDTGAGAAMIDAMARAGRGLPAAVLPFAVNQVTQVGLELLLSTAALGAVCTHALVPPARRAEADGLIEQTALANAVLAGLGFGDGRVRMVEVADPEALEAALWEAPDAGPMGRGDFLPMGRKRAVIGLALDTLHARAPAPVDVLELPAGAPFGGLDIDVEGCTLCLACVGACPTGALRDNPEKPQLRFLEQACVQCGLCTVTCPEGVVALVPRIDFGEAAGAPRTIKEEEPFACVRCGKLFGIRASVERTVEKLAGHAMFADAGRLDLVRMCDDCRVVAQLEATDHPLAGPPRPPPRSTDDYLLQREELRRMAAEAMAEPGDDAED